MLCRRSSAHNNHAVLHPCLPCHPACPPACPSACPPPRLPRAPARPPARRPARLSVRPPACKPKPLPCLPAGHPDGDGQYFHYLTKWAFALNELATATQDSKYLRFAVELMQTAHKAFTYKVGE